MDENEWCLKLSQSVLINNLITMKFSVGFVGYKFKQYP